MQRMMPLILSASLCFMLLGMPTSSVHAQSNLPEGELIKSNTIFSPPIMVVSNFPIATNLLPTMVVSNLPLVRSNLLPLGSNLPPVVTNFTFVQQTNYGPPIYPPSPPPKKPWWRRFWDWL